MLTHKRFLLKVKTALQQLKHKCFYAPQTTNKAAFSQKCHLATYLHSVELDQTNPEKIKRVLAISIFMYLKVFL